MMLKLLVIFSALFLANAVNVCTVKESGKTFPINSDFTIVERTSGKYWTFFCHCYPKGDGSVYKCPRYEPYEETIRKRHAMGMCHVERSETEKYFAPGRFEFVSTKNGKRWRFFCDCVVENSGAWGYNCDKSIPAEYKKESDVMCKHHGKLYKAGEFTYVDGEWEFTCICHTTPNAGDLLWKTECPNGGNARHIGYKTRRDAPGMCHVANRDFKPGRFEFVGEKNGRRWRFFCTCNADKNGWNYNCDRSIPAEYKKESDVECEMKGKMFPEGRFTLVEDGWEFTCICHIRPHAGGRAWQVECPNGGNGRKLR